MTSTKPPILVRAYADESGSNHVKDPGTYILAAAVIEVPLEEDVRATMNAMRLPGQAKLHWRDEQHGRRSSIARAVAASPTEHVVVVRSDPADLGGSRERARRKCFEALMWELTGLGVEHVVFESRGKADDKRDAHMLDAMRRTHALQGKIRLDHARGREEPLLWVPDAVCGTVADTRCGTIEHYAHIESKTTIIDI
ncbi:hypothetical protein [Humibacillus xanthopallidus]|uniref:hypothetical protein n=1 Tax=Humibacillus xanthopallidus TaxID=412689 RepID=UPI00384C8036